MKKVLKKIHELNVLCLCKTKLRKAILSNSDTELINTICECVYNILRGNVKTTPLVSKKLS